MVYTIQSIHAWTVYRGIAQTRLVWLAPQHTLLRYLCCQHSSERSVLCDWLVCRRRCYARNGKCGWRHIPFTGVNVLYRALCVDILPTVKRGYFGHRVLLWLGPGNMLLMFITRSMYELQPQFIFLYSAMTQSPQKGHGPWCFSLKIHIS